MSVSARGAVRRLVAVLSAAFSPQAVHIKEVT